MQLVYILLGGMAGVAIYLGYKKIQKQNTLAYLQMNFGKPSTRKYRYKDFENIGSYWELKYKRLHKRLAGKDEVNPYIDQWTWHDLDMDDVFCKINLTQSAIGESYLYDRLHYLHFDVKELELLEGLVRQMDRQGKQRLALEYIFYTLGKEGDNKIPFYLFSVQNKKSTYHPAYAILGLTPLIGLVLLLFNVQLGMSFLLVSAAINAFVHYKNSKDLAYELQTVKAIYKLLRQAKKVVALDVRALGTKKDKLAQDVDKLSYLLGIEARFFLSTDSDLGIVQEFLGIITLSQLRIYHRILKVLKREQKALQRIYSTMGLLDMSIAVASYRRTLTYYTAPCFTTEGVLDIEDMYHPLVKAAVANDVKLEGHALITGSNASGKSTFIKGIAINAILAQTIHTVLATTYNAPLSYLMSSMAIADSIALEESYYIAEIRSLKRIVDATKRYPFSICFVDEILKGTNTVERIAASTAILQSLAKRNCLCVVATHDIELTELLAQDYTNYHFRETVKADEITFDYKIHQGPATTRNAIKLLANMQYEEEIIKQADRLAVQFSETGSWQLHK